jgi:hypothetical protein
MKCHLPSSTLRRLLSLQGQLQESGPGISTVTAESQNGIGFKAPRNLLAAAFNPEGLSVVNAAGSFGRGVLSAGDRLREMIVPESLASLMAGVWTNTETRSLSKQELSLQRRLQDDLDEILAGSCPLCDNTVSNLERVYVQSAEENPTWRL